MKPERKLFIQEDEYMIRVKTKGNWNKTENFLKRNQNLKSIRQILEKCGREGVNALSATTPVDTGTTAGSWSYEIIQNEQQSSVVFTNNNVTSTGIPIAILLQYGHGNGRGGYVQGRDYINPAVQPIFDKIVEEAWKEVNK